MQDINEGRLAVRKVTDSEWDPHFWGLYRYLG